VHTPKKHVPPCASCGAPSDGGIFISQEDSHPAGCPIYTVEFYCKEHAPAEFIVGADRLYPVWRILRLYTPSKITIQRLLRERQIERVVGP
jgi:hypothetical protein